MYTPHKIEDTLLNTLNKTTYGALSGRHDDGKEQLASIFSLRSFFYPYGNITNRKDAKKQPEFNMGQSKKEWSLSPKLWF